MRPREFRVLDKEQQAELHAIWTVEQEIEGYYNSEIAKIHDRVEQEAKKRVV